MTTKLTPKQKDVLDYIKIFHAKNKYPPSVREIASALNISSPATIHAHLKQLIEKGYIKRSNNSTKQLQLLVNNEYDKDDNNIVSIPLIGKNTSNNPLEELDIPSEYFSIPSYLIPPKKEVFAYYMKDNSMISKGIYSKDIIIIEKTRNISNKDIVLSLLENNDLILRTYYKEKDYIRLEPECTLATSTILKNVTILGKIVGLYRKF